MRNLFNLILLPLASFGFWIFSSAHFVGPLMALVPQQVSHRSFEGVGFHEVIAMLLFALWAFLLGLFERELFTGASAALCRFVAALTPVLVFLAMHDVFYHAKFTLVFVVKMAVLGGVVLLASWLGFRMPGSGTRR